MPPKYLLSAYARTNLLLNGKPLAGTNSLPFPLFVITAHNPFGVKVGPLNGILHACLKLYAMLSGFQWKEVVGQSPDGQWQETGLAISGISEHHAITIGRVFCQWAVFRVDDEGKAVVCCW